MNSATGGEAEIEKQTKGSLLTDSQNIVIFINKVYEETP